MTRNYSKRIYYKEWVKECQDVLKKYDFPVTLRQLFYVLVAKGFIEKTESRYKGLSDHLVHARKDGYIGWNAIIDESREVMDVRRKYHSITTQLKELKEQLMLPYTLPRYYGQRELNLFFLEKDSLKPFIKPFLYPNSILVIGKGQNSWSNAYDLFQLDLSNLNIHLYTLVDYDLSGVHIHNSFVEQLDHFSIDTIEIQNIAVTEKQIDELHLEKDPRKNEVQLQAIDPEILKNLIIDTCDQNWNYELDKKRAELQKEMNEYYRKKENILLDRYKLEQENNHA